MRRIRLVLFALFVFLPVSTAFGQSPTVTVTANPTSIVENGGSSTVTIQLSSPAPAAVSGDIEFTGSASTGVVTEPAPDSDIPSSGALAKKGGGSDAQSDKGTFTIPKDASQTTFTITALDDASDEGVESIVINLKNVSGASAAEYLNAETVTIEDDDPTVTLEISTASFSENGGSTIVRANLSHASPNDVTIELEFDPDGTDTATGRESGDTGDGDYLIPSTSITVSAGQTSNGVIIGGIDDTLDEDPETFSVDIAAAGVTNGIDGSGAPVSATVQDDDSPPTISLSIDQSSANEDGSLSERTAEVTASLSTESAKDVSFSLDYDEGTAVKDTDFTSDAPGTITIPAGSTQETFHLTASLDNLDEDDEMAVVSVVDNPTNATEAGGDARATLTIIDDDNYVATITSSTDTFSESGGFVTLTATLSEANPDQSVRVNLAFTGTAVSVTDVDADGDYVLANSYIDINAGETQGTLTISGLSDDIDEGSGEDINVAVTTVENGTAPDPGDEGASVDLTITDDDATPVVTLSIDETSIAENSGTDVTVTATMTRESSSDVTVSLSFTGSASGSEVASKNGGDPTDYSFSSDEIVISAGAAGNKSTMTITPQDDTVDEDAGESLTVSITDIENGVEDGDQSVSLSITDDDAVPTVTIAAGAPSIAEDGGTTAVTATLSNPSIHDITLTLDYTGDATGIQSGGSGTHDYTHTGTSLTISAFSTSAATTLTAADDNIHESGNETATVTITDTGAHASDGATLSDDVVITDDDLEPTVSLSLANTTTTEGTGADHTVELTVSLSNPSNDDVDISLSYAGSATRGATMFQDYTSADAVTVPGLDTEASIDVTVDGDSRDDPDETIEISLGAIANGNGNDSVTLTITDDDTEPTVSLTRSSESVDEGAPNNTMTFDIELSAVSGKTVTVPMKFDGGTASGSEDSSIPAGPTSDVQSGLSAMNGGDSDDFTYSSASLDFAEGTTTKSVTITTIDDTDNEGDETIGASVDESGLINASVSAPQSSTVTLVENDFPPVAVDDSPSTDEDTEVTFDVESNDSDANNDDTSVSVLTGVSHGTLSETATDGTFTYTPEAEYNGTDAFTYTLSDGHGMDQTATVNITVTAVNDAPRPVADAGTTAEDTPITLDVLSNDVEVENDAMTAAVTVGPSDGTAVVNGDQTVTYTPNADFNGGDTFTYSAMDTGGKSATATVTVTITPVNDDPDPTDDVFMTPEDTATTFDVKANDTDIDSGSLSVSVLSDVMNGTLTETATDGTFDYSPDLDFNGTDTFTYTISDGDGGSATASVDILVGSDNDPPKSAQDEASTQEDVPVTIEVLANDVEADGESMTVSIDRHPSDGSVVVNDDQTVTYTPDPNFFGTDRFDYTATDETGLTDSELVLISVSAVNDVPVAMDDEASTDHAQSVSIEVLANDSDVESASLTVESLSDPTHGTAVVDDDGIITYTPETGFDGTDTFTYTVIDDESAADTATVTVTVNPIPNTSPVAVDDSAILNSGDSITLDVLRNDSDPDGDTISVHSVSQPSSGSATNNGDGTVTYAAASNFQGTDSFTYTVIDPLEAKATATVALTVTDPSPDGDGISDDVENGAPNNGDGNGDDIPDSDQPNVTSLPISTGDNAGAFVTVASRSGSSLATVQSTDNPSPDDFPAVETPAGFLSFSVNDIDSGESSIVSIYLPEGVTASGYMKFGPTPDDTNPHWYDFIFDGTTGAKIIPEVTDPGTGDVLERGRIDLYFTDGLRGDADLSVNGSIDDPGTPVIATTNTAPLAVSDEATVEEDGSVDISILDNDSDPDGDVVSLLNTGTPEHGTVAANQDSGVTYTPEPDYFGTDSFTYTVSDTRGATSQTSVTVTVEGVPDAPVAVNDEATTSEETPVIIDFLSNDYDPDNEKVSVSSVDSPLHGRASINNELKLKYTPDENFSGTDSFAYSIRDASGTTARGTITVHVEAEQDPPVPSADVSATDEDTAVTIDVLQNDIDADGDVLTIDSVTPASNGSVSIDTDGNVVYVPDPDFNGTDTFTYTVSDGSFVTSPVTVTVTVRPVADAPVFSSETPIIEGSSGPVWLSGNPNGQSESEFEVLFDEAHDADGDTLSYTWQLSLTEDFENVLLTTAASDNLTVTIAFQTLIDVLEPQGLGPGMELAAYQRLKVEDATELSMTSTPQQITFARGLSVANEESPEIPKEYYLNQNYPNPFNPSTTIEYGLPEAGFVRLEVFDMTGRLVQTLVNSSLPAGVHRHQARLDALPSGMYIYRLQTQQSTLTATMHMVK